MVKGMVDRTIKFLERKKDEDGPNLKKMVEIAKDSGIDLKVSSLTTYTADVREPFLSTLIENIEKR